MSEQKTVKIRPILAVVCDEVRQEANGKPFIIGIYTGSLAVESNEASPDAYNVTISLWIPFEVTEPGMASFEIVIEGPGSDNRIRTKGKLAIANLPQPTELTPLSIGPFPLKVWSDGQVRVLFKNDSDEGYQPLRILPVTFKAVPTAVNL